MSVAGEPTGDVVSGGFTYDHEGTALVYDHGRIERLGDRLAERDLRRALVVCGSNVGANEDVMGPVRRGLGDGLAAVFDGTTPEKSVEAAYEGIEAMERHDADVLWASGEAAASTSPG